ncbi:MAG: hypothetical protein COA43_15630 [Robiginitomaculum sp.]|nr:MAG: hypothetical protein COA43_15630 [Robiginitomaculum sp.]
MTKTTLGQNRLAASLKITLGICVIGLAGCSRTHVSAYDMNYAPSAYASSLQNSINANMHQQTQPSYYALYNDRTNSAVNVSRYVPMAMKPMSNREYPALRPAHSYAKPMRSRYAKQSMQTLRQIHHMPAMPSMQMQQAHYMPAMDRYTQNEHYGLYARQMPHPMPHQRPAMMQPHMNSHMEPQTEPHMEARMPQQAEPHMEPQMGHMQTQSVYAAPSAQNDTCMTMQIHPQNAQPHPNLFEQASLYCETKNTREVMSQPSIAEHFHDPITGEMYLPKMATDSQATQM